MATAPNRQTVYDFEGHLEAAFQAVLDLDGVHAFIRNDLFDPEAAPAPDTRVDLSVAMGPVDSQAAGFDPSGLLYYRDYQFTVTLRIQVSLDLDAVEESAKRAFPALSTYLGELRARIRAALEQEVVAQAWTESVAPYHTVAHLVPQGSIRETDEDAFMDYLELQWSGVVGIRDDALPAVE